jgi:hypothetical protein
MSAGDPERIRWVRYATDCAERVRGLTGEYRPQAEAAIRAARAWADDPTEKRLLACGKAASNAAVFDSDCAAHAADAAAYAARTPIDTTASVEASAKAAEAAAEAAKVSTYEIERAWQADRRRFYGLEAKP